MDTNVTQSMFDAAVEQHAENLAAHYDLIIELAYKLNTLPPPKTPTQRILKHYSAHQHGEIERIENEAGEAYRMFLHTLRKKARAASMHAEEHRNMRAEKEGGVFAVEICTQDAHQITIACGTSRTNALEIALEDFDEMPPLRVWRIQDAEKLCAVHGVVDAPFNPTNTLLSVSEEAGRKATFTLKDSTPRPQPQVEPIPEINTLLPDQAYSLELWDRIFIASAPNKHLAKRGMLQACAILHGRGAKRSQTPERFQLEMVRELDAIQETEIHPQPISTLKILGSDKRALRLKHQGSLVVGVRDIDSTNIQWFNLNGE